MATRIYTVTYKERMWLVRASTQSQAVAYVAKNEMDVRVASQDDIYNLVSNGDTVYIANKHDTGLILGGEK